MSTVGAALIGLGIVFLFILGCFMISGGIISGHPSDKDLAPLGCLMLMGVAGAILFLAAKGILALVSR